MERTLQHSIPAAATQSPGRLAIMMAVGLAVGLPIVAAHAQVRELPPRGPIVATPIPPPHRMPTLGCCRCLGEQNTLDLSTGPGNAWKVNGQPAVVVAQPNVAWSNTTNGAKWISIDAAGSGAANATYRYTLQFKVQKCTIPQQIVFKGLSVAADNGYKVYLTGPGGSSPVVPCPAAAAATGHCFTAGNQLNNFATWPVAIVPGTYTLNVDVTNISGPSGMFLSGKLEGQCAKEPVQPVKPGDGRG